MAFRIYSPCRHDIARASALRKETFHEFFVSKGFETGYSKSGKIIWFDTGIKIDDEDNLIITIPNSDDEKWDYPMTKASAVGLYADWFDEDIDDVYDELEAIQRKKFSNNQTCFVKLDNLYDMLRDGYFGFDDKTGNDSFYYSGETMGKITNLIEEIETMLRSKNV